MLNLNFQSTRYLPYLILDKCPAHTHKSVREFIANSKLHHRFISSGCTGVIQPIDTYIGKPFKDRLKALQKEWFDEIGSLSSNTTKEGNFKDPELELMVEWILEVFNGINQDLIAKPFKHCGINLSLDGKEDHLLNPKMEVKDEFLNTIREALLSASESRNR